MNICYLHIGPHKTASTTLQTLLVENAPILFQNGVFCPWLNTENDIKRHHLIAAEFGRGQSDLQRKKLREDIIAAGCPRTIVLSSETFSHFISRADVRERIVVFFDGLGYSVKVVAYIRPQMALACSLYSERIGGFKLNMSFDDYVMQFLNSPQFDYLNYYRALYEDNRFETVFAPYNVTTLQFGVCLDFLKRLGLNLAADTDFKIPTNRNDSMGPKTVAALFEIIRFLDEQSIKLLPNEIQQVRGALRKEAFRRGWEKEKFQGLSQAQKVCINENFVASNDTFSKMVWLKPWIDIFGSDERTIMEKPCNRYLPELASIEEREEFQEFVWFGISFALLNRPSHTM
jgi:hypothetical protein